MAVSDTEFSKMLKKKLRKYDAVIVPVKASRLEIMTTKKVPIEKLHPNPEDEFCDPKIGPHFGIIGDYTSKFMRFGTMTPSIDDEPLMVQKIHPDGYMILNGHHRWAAALRCGFRKVPVKIVNLAQETDIEKMIAASEHDKRVTLDLDETIFCRDEFEPAEKPLKFPYNKMYKEHICLGLPMLMHYLAKEGYDVWVYSANCYSIDYIRSYFSHYSVKIDGIITGTGKKTESAEARKRTEGMIADKYVETVHIDRNMILCTKRGEKDFQEYELDPDSPTWARDTARILRKIFSDGKNGDK